ncbi:MAG: repair protein radA protein [Candidatus Magasanikbacteria bacterium GW2011_GWC2_41_17]|uniref:DNA repair protein RadA n=1 Tax=Candidatus Magasanikbacteria bacterium GW2011_GWC2_41_17 TaxID=1619048 RepID=A0A0G0YGK4_9BACT|nr:MAG: repair protein radA protein [Candidatus Magasanikbacteria bacterium GW2011_GWC2_41_17]
MECGSWSTIKETGVVAAQIKNLKDKKNNAPAGKTINFGNIIGQEVTRLKTGMDEFDRVLGGGLAPGGLTLLGGEPGIGKSTLVLQIASALPTKVLYVSGEESAEQVKLRFDRLKLQPSQLEFLDETNVETICATIEQVKPALAIVDSIQTLTSIEVTGPAGNPTQLKAACAKLTETAKNTRVPIIIIGHVTKEGTLGGPKTLEHIVDTVMYLEGDKFHQFRILRSVKNRFGSTAEAGIFEMTALGLKEVKNPSEAFLSGRGEPVPGSIITCLIAGSRPILLEIQALVTRTNFGYPQRRASGFDLNRLQVLIAVLAKRTGLPLESYDIFLNVIGGLKADEPAADLAVVLAIASALKNKNLPPDLVAFGEVGLGGEVRPVAQMERRLSETQKMGMKYAVLPPTKELLKSSGIKIAHIKNVKEVIEKIISGAEGQKFSPARIV